VRARIFVGLFIFVAGGPVVAASTQSLRTETSPQAAPNQFVDPGLRNNKKHQTERSRPLGPPNRDALLMSCRKQVFRKYGFRTPYGMLALRKEFVVQRVDTCVAAGGVAN